MTAFREAGDMIESRNLLGKLFAHGANALVAATELA